jgi:hypothetical protein
MSSNPAMQTVCRAYRPSDLTRQTSQEFFRNWGPLSIFAPSMYLIHPDEIYKTSERTILPSEYTAQQSSQVSRVKISKTAVLNLGVD